MPAHNPGEAMANRKPLLLLTRPMEASNRFASALPKEALSKVHLCISPLIEITFRQTEVEMEGVRGVIFTSANAVRAAQQLNVRPNVPAFGVGAVTVQRALDAGWSATLAGETATELLSALRTSPPDTPLLHLSGRNLRVDLATELSASGIETRSCTIYEQPVQELSREAHSQLAQAQSVIAPVFSPRSAEQLALQVPQSDRIHVVAISHAVTQALKSRSWASIYTADSPTAESIICAVTEAVERLTRVEGHNSAQ